MENFKMVNKEEKKMNLSKQVKSLGMVAAIAAAAALHSTAINAATITFAEGDQLIENFDPLVSTTFSLDLVANNLLPDTNGGGLIINFDNTIVNITNSTINTATWNFASSASADNATGVFDLNLISFFSPAPASTTSALLVTIDFEVIGTGAFDFVFSERVNSPWGYTLPVIDPVPVVESGVYCLTPGTVDCSTFDLAELIQLSPTNVTVYAADVPPVPVPAAIWLFGSGLIGLVAVSRRKAV